MLAKRGWARLHPFRGLCLGHKGWPWLGGGQQQSHSWLGSQVTGRSVDINSQGCGMEAAGRDETELKREERDSEDHKGTPKFKTVLCYLHGKPCPIAINIQSTLQSSQFILVRNTDYKILISTHMDMLDGDQVGTSEDSSFHLLPTPALNNRLTLVVPYVCVGGWCGGGKRGHTTLGHTSLRGSTMSL